MPDTAPTTATDQVFTSMRNVLNEIVRSSVHHDALEAQRILLQRLVQQGNMFPAPIPARLNITEIGGYLDLLKRAGLHEPRALAMANALGVVDPPPLSVALTGAPPVRFVDIGNDRPANPAQASIVPTLQVRADFATPLLEARAQWQTLGCQVPLLAPVSALPANLPGAQPAGLDDATLFGVLGRSLEVFPGTVLRDPAADPLAIARPESPATETFRLVARELDGSGQVSQARWVAQRASSTAVIDEPATDQRYLELAPILEAAGWLHPSPAQRPATLSQPGTLMRWINLTGLIADKTRLGDELALMYPPAAIAHSSLAAFTGWRWDGERFAAPVGG
jgi:hypothetical protein